MWSQGAYSGKETGQSWKSTPAGCTKTGATCDMHSPVTAPPNWCINIPGSKAPTEFQGFNFVTYPACGSANSLLLFKVI